MFILPHDTKSIYTGFLQEVIIGWEISSDFQDSAVNEIWHFRAIIYTKATENFNRDCSRVFISTVIIVVSACLRPPVGETLNLLFPVSVGIPWRYTEAQCIIPRGVLLRHTLVSGLPKAENQSGTLLFAN